MCYQDVDDRFRNWQEQASWAAYPDHIPAVSYEQAEYEEAQRRAEARQKKDDK